MSLGENGLLSILESTLGQIHDDRLLGAHPCGRVLQEGDVGIETKEKILDANHFASNLGAPTVHAATATRKTMIDAGQQYNN